MDFGALPPEINSTRMYSGSGSGPLLAAASAWDGLAAELNSSATAYGSAITGLTSAGWQGPSSTMMATAIAPYVAWMHSAAAQAEQTSVQAKTAVAAYQTAFAATVPPPLIAANRSQLMSLVASNFFGQNSPAIATTEADYDRMWAQDTAAMYGYAASSSTASRLTPFTNPPPTTNSAGVAAQTAAAAQSASSPAPQLLAQLPAAMQQLAAPAAAPAAPGLGMFTPVDLFNNTVSSTSAAASTTSASVSGSSIATTNNAVGIAARRDDAQGIGPFFVGSTSPIAPFAPPRIASPTVSAGLGRASFVNTLSVPASWSVTATPPVNPAGLALPTTTAAAAPSASAAMPGTGMFGESLLGTLAGRGVSNVAAKMRRPSVVPRSPAAG